MVLALLGLASRLAAGESQPWTDPQNALIVDAYELNTIDWEQLLQDKRISAFISKASDGLPESFSCTGDHAGDTFAHCKTMWRKYAVSRELYQTRRMLAKMNGLLWGAYHLGRPGNPVDQANHFLDYADPKPDELMVLDIEGLDVLRYMSLSDAQVFVGHIKVRTGRYPILYTNHNTAQYIADHRQDYPILARLPLWYARYKSDVKGTFPLGNWDTYALWQFASSDNCSDKSCPYRVPGTLKDIDVNVVPMTKLQLAKVWPQGDLLPTKPMPAPDMMIAKAPSCNGPRQTLISLMVDPVVTASTRRSEPVEINELNYQDF
ncbi:lysozyme [Agrobacterium rhizogenes]|nr:MULTISPECIES: GH25 family lysozyme [Rhizobium]MDJ1638124.1 GH25 family lysozyme [Rhizobium rhizogenes]NTG85374.1 lysozyme [Rhizobium rhizogenes]NTH11339.1 lysozyme [Rhizobium rhizogenes]NTH17710.1 lysozyme [Rhizobium rhizogenes]NTH30682.1 lysozyme [Rhizobium rhizogenes]